MKKKLTSPAASIPAQGVAPITQDAQGPDDENDQGYDEIGGYGGHLSLAEDPETSLVGSLYLHLLSEHGCYDALRLDERDAGAFHEEIHHPAFAVDHAYDDHRFRPLLALAVSLRGTETGTEAAG